MEKYEVVIREKSKGNRWSFMCLADDFAHAEEQAINATEPKDNEEIIRIEKDYDSSTD